MAVIVNVIKEVALRIAAAKTATPALYKELFIGAYEQYRTQGDYPIVIITPPSTSIDPDSMDKFTMDTMSFKVVLISNNLDATQNSGNVLYKESGTLGALFFLEKIMNAIDKNRTTSLSDTNLAAACHDPITYSSATDQSGDKIVSVITINCNTARYVRGAR
jgi:hypothetical protein